MAKYFSRTNFKDLRVKEKIKFWFVYLLWLKPLLHQAILRCPFFWSCLRTWGNSLFLLSRKDCWFYRITVGIKAKSQVRKSVVQFWFWKIDRVKSAIKVEIEHTCLYWTNRWSSWCFIDVAIFHFTASVMRFWGLAHTKRIRIGCQVSFFCIIDWKHRWTFTGRQLGLMIMVYRL